MDASKRRPVHKPWDDLSDQERLLFLASALVDFNIVAESAYAGCRLADEKSFLGKPIYVALATVAAISYCRPFLGSDLSGKAQTTRFPPDISPVLDAFRELHGHVLSVRSNSIAHSYLGLRQGKIWRDGTAYVSQVSHEILEPARLDELGTLAVMLKDDLDLMFQQIAARVHPKLVENDGMVPI